MLLLLALYVCTTSSVRASLIDGYTDKVAYFQTDTAKVYLNWSQVLNSFNVRIFDVNDVVVATVPASVKPQTVTTSEPWKNGYNYELTLRIVCASLPPGIYHIEKKVPFLVKLPACTKPILVLYPSNTVAAYTNTGGKSLYNFNSSNLLRDSMVSFIRPLRKDPYYIGFFKWLKSQPNIASQVNFISDFDMENYQNLECAQMLIMPGHHEYWTRNARKNFDKFVANGHNALLLTGNTMWWQVRYNADNTKLICYKDESDPIADLLLRTDNWDSIPPLDYPILKSIGADFNMGGYGHLADNGWNGYKILERAHPAFSGVNLSDSIIHILTREYDSPPIGFKNNRYYIKNDSINFYCSLLLGVDSCLNEIQTHPNTGAFYVAQPTDTSGLIVNVSSSDWCSAAGILGPDSARIRKITLNLINWLRTDTCSCYHSSKANSIENIQSDLNSLCPQDYGVVTFKPIGNYSSQNSFILQMSDANGDFTNPVTLSSISSTGNRNLGLPLTRPAGLPNGTGYLFRIRSTLPVCTSATLQLPLQNCITSTKLSSTYCNATIALLSDLVTCQVVPLSTNYRYQFTNGTFSSTYTRGTSSSGFRPSWVSGLEAGKTYNVRVAAYVNGCWGNYGTACNLTIQPAASKISPAFCNSTLSTLSQVITCVAVPGATNYRYRVVNTLGFDYTYTRNSSTTGMRMSWIPGLTCGNSYRVSVAAFVAGLWTNYGDECTITTPICVKAVDGTKNIQETNQFEIYPNPSLFDFTFSFTGYDFLEISVVDMLGKMVIEPAIVNSDTKFVFGEALPRGIYIAFISDGNKIMYRKLLK